MDSTTILYTCLSLFLFFISFKFLTSFKKHKKLPPSPPFLLPFLGHLRLIKPPLHRTFSALSQKYGPIISLPCGSRLIVVISSPSVARECLTKNDIIFANRPDFLNAKVIAYNYTTIGTSNYGEHWRNVKRMVGNEVLSPNRLNDSLNVRRDEVKRLLLKLARGGGGGGGGHGSESSSDDVFRGFVKVELKSLLFNLTLNNIIGMVSGKRSFGDDNDKETSNCKEIMAGIMEFSGAGYMPDYLPILSLFSSKYVESLKDLSNRMDSFLQGLINEQVIDKNNAFEHSLIHRLLKLRKSEPDKYSDLAIKSIMQSMLLGGTHTTASTLEWALSSLLNNPHVLQKAKAEIDSLIGQDRLIDEPDMANLPYLQGIIDETLQLYPTFPLLLPHYSSEDCQVAGYDVPRNTIVLFNAWAIQNDPKVWDDPTSFNPDRFRKKNKELDNHYKFMSFGLGRRSCPGEALARRAMGLTIGAVIQCFDWKRVSGELIDMTEGVGLTMDRLEPLNALCKARPIMKKVIAEAEVFYVG